MRGEVKIIELWPLASNCYVCGVYHQMQYHLYFYEGKIVSENFRDPVSGMPPCGAPVCDACFDKHKDTAQDAEFAT